MIRAFQIPYTKKNFIHIPDGFNFQWILPQIINKNVYGDWIIDFNGTYMVLRDAQFKALFKKDEAEGYVPIASLCPICSCFDCPALIVGCKHLADGDIKKEETGSYYCQSCDSEYLFFGNMCRDKERLIQKAREY